MFVGKEQLQEVPDIVRRTHIVIDELNPRQRSDEARVELVERGVVVGHHERVVLQAVRVEVHVDPVHMAELNAVEIPVVDSLPNEPFFICHRTGGTAS